MNNSDRVFNLVWGDIEILLDEGEKAQVMAQVSRDTRKLIQDKMYSRVADVMRDTYGAIKMYSEYYINQGRK